MLSKNQCEKFMMSKIFKLKNKNKLWLIVHFKTLCHRATGIVPSGQPAVPAPTRSSRPPAGRLTRVDNGLQTDWTMQSFPELSHLALDMGRYFDKGLWGTHVSLFQYGSAQHEEKLSKLPFPGPASHSWLKISAFINTEWPNIMNRILNSVWKSENSAM